ncbi:MAG: hypothetical protein U1F83_13380 [Verrucomicrobiota bacterium]
MICSRGIPANVGNKSADGNCSIPKAVQFIMDRLVFVTPADRLHEGKRYHDEFAAT